ncbi:MULTISPECIES: ABC transporter permease [unclassified Mesorhizobium]|uniref:ABC transporter permease n=1 Tax=Mesorhizobium TaxID=68287 RepID=UPI0003CEBD18|nr:MULTISPECIES: ABC transporter permease [unclassified Mesorhizobium]ESY94519.1 polyamine ABC transporter permease [Mesorhizobium sp. LNHC229A00]ESY97750.1 polyamine ABC transporter permease [Mesorhizobium sp. LNHC209A00]
MPTYRPGPVSLVIAALVALFLLLPLLAVIPVSLTPSRMLAMPTGELSLRHYRSLIEDPRWLQSILLSIRIGIVSSAISTVLALCFSLGVWMFQPRFTATLVGFVLLPMVVPPVVSAVTLYFLLTSISGVSSFFGYDTWLGVAMAHSVMTVPFATVLILVSLSQLDRRIDLAARGLGASVWERATRVIMPNIKFGIVTAALLSFVLSWEEIGVTLFITSVNAITLPRLMWMGLRDNIDPAIAALSVILIIITVLVLAVRSVVVRLNRGSRPL